MRPPHTLALTPTPLSHTHTHTDPISAAVAHISRGASDHGRLSRSPPHLSLTPNKPRMLVGHVRSATSSTPPCTPLSRRGELRQTPPPPCTPPLSLPSGANQLCGRHAGCYS